MIDLFERCGEIASVGIIVDFSEDTETYIVGTPADIKAWAYGDCPMKAPKGLMRHSNKAGNLVKDINRLMKVKYELNEIMEISGRLCNADALCDGSCNLVLEELSEYYDMSEYANIVKNYIIYFLFSKFKLRQKDFNKKIGLSVKGNHDRAEKYIELFKADSEKIFRPFISARAADIFDIRTAIRSSNEVLDSSLYRVHDDNTNISLYVANDSILTLLDIYSDIMSDAGRIITNCENCGQLMITKRSNASLTCGRTTCKKERLYKVNDDYKKRAMADPIKEAYLNFDNKCRSYRKKLSGYPDLLEKYNKAFDERREKIRAFKSGLTAGSSTKDIDRYNQMCFDACQDLQDLSKRLKAKMNENSTLT
ncbi:MAG: hypothetical protein MSH60_05615 [Ruminococcus sp.]|nr:hypothetical protein [Ruminococcus sp.]